MRATIPIAVQPNTRVLRLERHLDNDVNHAYMNYWQLWLHHDIALTQGTFLRLYDDGSIEQVTADADGIEQVIRIKHADS